jgi:hypothetical protein
MPFEEKIVNEYISYSSENGILYATFLKNVVIDLVAARKIFEDRINTFGKNDYASLVDSTGVRSFTKEARDFLSSDEAIKGVKATAILVSGYLSSAIANFFLKVTVKKPKVPTKIFSDRQKAIAWLQQYK